MPGEKTTSVQVDKDLHEQFKIECIRYNYTLKNLVNYAMQEYVNNQQFRESANKSVFK